MDDELLTPEEVAKILKVEKHFVLQLVKRGEIPARRLGTRTIRLLTSEVQKYLAEKTEG